MLSPVDDSAVPVFDSVDELVPLDPAGPHWPETPPPPQVSGGVHPPQSMIPPQPSGCSPQVSGPMLAQVRGQQSHA
jgi:hypothetical protein